jgi:hypothetical protein
MKIDVNTKFNIGDPVLLNNRKGKVESIEILAYDAGKTNIYYRISGKMGSVAESALEAIHE